MASPPIEDKRLWVVESEFANVLHQGRRNGNTLSAALRDCWDGVHLKPATKTNRVYASNPHMSLSGAISPSELTGLMNARELSNGFANRFLMIWAERTRILPFPKETPQSLVEHLAMKTLQVLEFVGADRPGEPDLLRMDLSASAQWRYAQLYRDELNSDLGDGVISALLERQAPMLLRLAMLMALSQPESRIADILALNVEEHEEGVRVVISIVESKYVGSDGLAKARRESKDQLLSTLGMFREALFGDPGRLDRDVWLARLADMLIDAEIPPGKTGLMERARAKLREGDVEISLRGYSHVYVHSADAGASSSSDQELLEESDGVQAWQEVFDRPELRKLAEAYAKGTDGIEARS